MTRSWYWVARVKLESHSCNHNAMLIHQISSVQDNTRLRSKRRTQIVINNPVNLASELLGVSASTAYNIVKENTSKQPLSGKRKRESSILIEVADYCRQSQFRVWRCMRGKITLLRTIQADVGIILDVLSIRKPRRIVKHLMSKWKGWQKNLDRRFCGSHLITRL